MLSRMVGSIALYLASSFMVVTSVRAAAIASGDGACAAALQLKASIRAATIEKYRDIRVSQESTERWRVRSAARAKRLRRGGRCPLGRGRGCGVLAVQHFDEQIRHVLGTVQHPGN